MEQNFTWFHLGGIIAIVVLLIQTIALVINRNRQGISPEGQIILDKQTDILRSMSVSVENVKDKAISIHDNLNNVSQVTRDCALAAGRLENNSKEEHKEIFSKLNRIAEKISGN